MMKMDVLKEKVCVCFATEDAEAGEEVWIGRANLITDQSISDQTDLITESMDPTCAMDAMQCESYQQDEVVGEEIDYDAFTADEIDWQENNRPADIGMLDAQCYCVQLCEEIDVLNDIQRTIEDEDAVKALNTTNNHNAGWSECCYRTN